MKQKYIKILFWSASVLIFLLFTGPSHASKRLLTVNATMGEKVVSQTSSTIKELNEIHEEMMETIDQTNQIFFGQIARLIDVHGDLGALLRNHDALKFKTAEDIEYIRFNLDTMISEHTAFQMRVSEHIGKAQEELGRFIVDSQKEMSGTVTLSQERLAKLIRDSALLHKKLATEVINMRIRLGKELQDHAALLIRVSQKMGRSGNQLRATIVHHSETLRSAKGELLAQDQLSETMNKGAEAGEALLIRFEKSRSPLGF
ncbi:MAG: hypothetical protein ACE5FY_05600 [Nitrospiria bacterium]